MSYQRQQNDRKRRRRAKVVTFLITAALFAAGAYGLGVGEELVASFFGEKAEIVSRP